MGIIIAICVSKEKGTAKQPVASANCLINYGLEHDAHAGSGHRQISLLSLETIDAFKRRGAMVRHGAFGENLVLAGIDCAALPPGTRLSSGDVLLEITQIGKECHSPCAIYHAMGECIMPSQGVFARVLGGGILAVGDTVTVLTAAKAENHGVVELSATNAENHGVVELSAAKAKSHTVAVLTISDKGSAGLREDMSGKAAIECARGCGYALGHYGILPDEAPLISAELTRLCDQRLADLVLTTGGTGFAARDVTPEATLAVIERLCPGIPEAMRAASLTVTKRAMFSRAVAGIRGKTLIVNLPGSPRAVRECLEFVLPDFAHALDILAGSAGECARGT